MNTSPCRSAHPWGSRSWISAFGRTAAVALLAMTVVVVRAPGSMGAEADAFPCPIRLHYEPTASELGDPIPFYWDGVYHVFYLSCSKIGQDRRIAWAHISSRDLLNWREHPQAIEGCLTGSIVEKDGLFHAFTTESGAVGHAVSRDLDSWQKDPKFVLPIDPRWYEVSWRDPCVDTSPKGVAKADGLIDVPWQRPGSSAYCMTKRTSVETYKILCSQMSS